MVVRPPGRNWAAAERFDGFRATARVPCLFLEQLRQPRHVEGDAAVLPFPCPLALLGRKVPCQRHAKFDSLQPVGEPMPRGALNPIDKHVGSLVRMRRLMLDMSQTDLGNALGLTFQQVQKYEKGANRIGPARLQHLSQILQVPVPFFFEGAPASIGRPGAEESAEGSFSFVRQRLPCHFRGFGLDKGVHLHRRCKTAPRHRPAGGGDRAGYCVNVGPRQVNSSRGRRGQLRRCDPRHLRDRSPDRAFAVVPSLAGRAAFQARPAPRPFLPMLFPMQRSWEECDFKILIKYMIFMVIHVRREEIYFGLPNW